MAVRAALVIAGATVALGGSALAGTALAVPASFPYFPQLTFSPAPYSYGQVTTGHTATETFTLTHSGFPLRPPVVDVRLAGSSEFTIVSDPCAPGPGPRPPSYRRPLGLQWSCTVTVQFSAATAGPARATLTATLRSTPQLSATAMLSGTGELPHTAPVLGNIETSTLQYDAGSPGADVTSTLTVSSADATTLAGASVAISSGLTESEDSLGFTAQNGITGSYDPITGVLTLTGTASLADYQAALRSVTYADSNGVDPVAGPRTITFQVNDGTAVNNLSNVVSRTVQVNANPPPVANNVPANTNKNTAVDINVLASDSDPNGLPLAVTSVETAGTKGSVSVNPTDTIRYNPDGQFQTLTLGQSATDSFGYTISDGFHEASATVTVTVDGVDDAPVISNVETAPLVYQSQAPAVAVTSTLTLADDDDTTMSGATVAVTSGLDSGADILSFTNQNGITGSYDASTGVLTLTGDASLADYQSALRSVEFSTTDSSVSPAARTVAFTATDTLGATSNTASRIIDVSEAPQPPLAVNQSYTAVGNTTLGVGTTPSGPAVDVTGTLLTGDATNATCGMLSVTGNTSPAHGSATVDSSGTFTYLPAAGFSGADTFQYTIGCSESTKTATATVTITVGTVVWYVNSALGSAGDGESNAPFNTLAAADGAVGPNSIVFLYQGAATYTGGITLHSGDSLWGQPHGLTVDGHALVAAGGAKPAITNSAGNGITLASGVDVEDVAVTSPSAEGISGTDVSGTVIVKDCTVTGSATAQGTVAIQPAPDGTTTLTISQNTIQTEAPVYAIDVDPDATSATGSLTGTISANTIGSPTVSNSGGGIGINLMAEGFFSETVAVTGNHISQYENDSGISFETDKGAATMNLTITGNTVSHPGSFGSWGIIGEAGAQTGDAGTVCADITGNSIAESAQPGQGGADIELDQFGSANYRLPGYTGASTDGPAVASFLAANNTGDGTATAVAVITGTGGFLGGSGCAAP